MSVPVDIDNLDNALDEYGLSAFLVSTGDDGHPHITHVSLSICSDGLLCDIGRKTSRNASSRPSAAMFWPPIKFGGHSLIVDGVVSVAEKPEGGFQGVFKPKSAILHRSNPPSEEPTQENCSNDCRPISAKKV
ncbi:MAG: hypothetical protein CL470_04790 [Acidimicrobiaceae bacterium]|nr:hypothetical protein [Acidimicrobiaceae bacterium]|tara:strand:+ start:2232 stop:2630 length:399 start_codon:yes stop_codon:yes gene_type:complete